MEGLCSFIYSNSMHLMRTCGEATDAPPTSLQIALVPCGPAAASVGFAAIHSQPCPRSKIWLWQTRLPRPCRELSSWSPLWPLLLSTEWCCRACSALPRQSCIVCARCGHDVNLGFTLCPKESHPDGRLPCARHCDCEWVEQTTVNRLITNLKPGF